MAVARQDVLPRWMALSSGGVAGT